MIVLYGLLLCLHPWLPQAAAVGSFLVFVMSFVTLSFLITTPECWVPALGDAQHGFPYLSGAGRLVIKDAIMMGAALVTMADSAKAYLRKRSASEAEKWTSAERTLGNGCQLKSGRSLRPCADRRLPARRADRGRPINLTRILRSPEARENTKDQGVVIAARFSATNRR